MWCETVGCESPSGSIRLQMQTGASLVASRFMIRTRAGSPRARNTSAVAVAWSVERTSADRGAQHSTATVALIDNHQYIDERRYVVKKTGGGYRQPSCRS